MINVDSFPRMIIFDIVNVCNLRCLHCPHKDIVKSAGYKPQYLDLRLYKKAIDEIAGYKVDLVRFTGDGEPLLHRNILEMIAYAKSKVNGKINLTTNGLMLNERNSEFLLNLPIDFIDISIDAFSEEKYNLIRQGGDFKKLISNVHSLINLKLKYKSPAKIMVNMISQEISKDEIESFRDYWQPLVDYVLIRNLHTVNNYLQVDTKALANNNGRYPCPHIYKRITIDFKANMKFCAHDWFDRAIIGNLKNDSVLDVWNGALYTRLRYFHEHGEFHKISLCANCRDWASVAWEYGYDKVIKNLGTRE